MSSVIVLDSSDEDETPAKKIVIPHLNSSTTITLIKSKEQTHPLYNTADRRISDSKVSKAAISNTLLSPTITTTIAKPKPSTLPKINAAFTSNATAKAQNSTSATPKKPTHTLPSVTTSNMQQKILQQHKKSQQSLQHQPWEQQQNKKPSQLLQQNHKQHLQQQQQQHSLQQQSKKQQPQQQKPIGQKPCQQQQKKSQQLFQQQSLQQQQKKKHLDQQSLQQQQQQKKKHLDQQSLQQQQQKKKHLDQQSLPQQLQQSLWHKSPSQQQQLQQDQIQQMQLLRKSGDHCYSKPILQKQRPFQQQSLQEQSVPQNSLQQQQQKKRQQEKKKQEMQKHRQNEQHRQQLEDNLHKFEKGYLQQKLLELQKDLMQKPQNKRQSLEIQAQTLQRQQNLQAQPAQLRHQPLSLQHQPQELQNRSQSLQNRSLSLQNRTQPLQRQTHQAQSQQQYLQKQQQLQSPQQQQQKSPQQQKLQQSTQRKRKLSPSPTPIALMPATSSYNILPSMLMLNSSASMMPIIPDMHSMTPSATPPFQLLATPTSLASPPRLRPPSSLASTSSSTYSCFIQASDSYRASIPPLKNNVDNFKIRLPLKHPNNVNSTSTTTSVSTSLTTAASRATATPTNTNSTLTKPTITATTATSTTTPATSTTTPATSTTTPATSTTTPATSTPTSTASLLRGVKRIKPTTLLKKSDEAWLMRRTKPAASGTPVGLSQLEDDIMEVLPTPLPPSSSVSPKSPLTTLQELYGTGAQRGRFATTKQVSAPPVPVAISASPLSTTPPRSLTPKTVSPTKPATPAMRTHTSIEYSDKSVAPITRAPAVRMVGEKLSPNQPQPARNTKVSTDTQKKSDRTPVFDLTNSPEKPSIKRSYSLMSPPSSSSATTPGAISPPVSSASKAVRKNGTPAIIDLADIDSIKNTVDITEQKGQQAREPLSSEFEDLLRVCRTADPSDDMDNLIKKKLTRLFYETDSVFVRSICFRKQLRSTIERIEANPRLVYFNLSGILNILKARREKPVEASIQQSEKQTSEMAVEVEPTGDEHKDEEIKKLNEELRLVRKRIEQLEEAEVDFDDDDSSYLQLERWKKRACQIYEKICELTGERKNALRLVRKPIKFNGTEYPQFNRKLQAFVNQTKEFPDYTDVLRILEHCNEVHKLGLAQFEMKHIAEDAFIKVGKSLQSRRKTDLHETVTHYISNTKDPAATDPTLLAKLSENQKLKKNINEIFEKYARKQDQTAEEIRLKKAATAAANAATATVNASGDAPKSSTKYNDILTAITTADDTVAVVTEEDIAEIDDNDDEDEDEEDDDEEDGDEDEPIEIEDEAERIEISDDDDDDDYDEGGDDDGKEDDGDEDEAGGDNDSTDSETDNERDGTKNLDDVSTDENEFILDTYVTKAAIGKKVNAEESLISKTSNSEEKIIGSQLDKSSATKSPEFFNIYDSKDNSRNSYNNLSSTSSNNFNKRRSSNSNNNNNNNLSSNKNQEFSSLTKKRRPSLCLKKFASMKTAINNKKQSKETVTNGTRTTTKRANSPPPSIPPPPPSLPPPSSSIPPSPSSSIPPPPPSIPPPTTTIGMTPATTLKITSVSSLNESVNKITSNGNLSNRCTYSPQATKSHTFAEIVISDEET